MNRGLLEKLDFVGMFKILHLIDSGGLYGAERVILDLMEEQKENGLKPILGSIAEPGIRVKAIEKVAMERGLRVERFRMKRGPNVFGAMRIVCRARQENVQVIHCHGYKANILMSLLPRSLRKLPYVSTLHGWTSIMRYSKMSAYAWADVWLAKRADRVVVVCEAMMRDARVVTAGLKPVVVRNGIQGNDEVIGTEKPWQQLRRDLTGRGLVLGTIGRLSAEKGFDILLWAFAKIIEKGYHASLVVVGEGQDRLRLQEISRQKGIADRVVFTGYLDQADSYMKAFDLFVMASLTEGLPITLLEAMWAGIPIVATRVGGIPEALDYGRCGILVSPGDANDLAKGIIVLADSVETRVQLARSGKERVQQEFSAAKMAHGYRKIYEQILNSKGRIQEMPTISPSLETHVMDNRRQDA